MRKISKCDCLLKGSVEVPYRPFSNVNSEVVFIFESPGQNEIRQGEMLIGPSYKLMKNICAEVGLNWDKFFLMNAARCMIDTKSLSDGQISKILQACRSKFKTALKFSKRKLIVCFGRIAYWRTTGKKTQIEKARNHFIWSDEFECYILHLPSCFCI